MAVAKRRPAARERRRPRIPEIRPMLATVATEMPRGDGWVFEPKYDGIRILAVVSNGSVRLLSRNAIDRTGDFPGVAQAVARWPHAYASAISCSTVSWSREPRAALGGSRIFSSVARRSRRPVTRAAPPGRGSCALDARLRRRVSRSWCSICSSPGRRYCSMSRGAGGMMRSIASGGARDSGAFTSSGSYPSRTARSSSRGPSAWDGKA